MNNPENVIVTPWKIPDVPLEHWFREHGRERLRVVGVIDDELWITGKGRVSLSHLATHYLHSEHPVGDRANWQRCGHVEPRGVVWVGRDDLYFRSDTAVINGVRYAVDGAESVTVTVNESSATKKMYPFAATNKTRRISVAADGRYSVTCAGESVCDVVPAIRMEAK